VSEVRSAERPRSVQCLATLYRLAIFINTHCFRSPKPIKNDVRDKMGTAITSEPAGPTHLPQEYRPHEFRDVAQGALEILNAPIISAAKDGDAKAFELPQKQFELPAFFSPSAQRKEPWGKLGGN
jgi:hypothetical protein